MSKPETLLEFQRWLEKNRLLHFHNQRVPFRPVSRHARQGAGLCARLDFARAAGLHQPAVRSAGHTCAGGSRRQREHAFPAHSRNSFDQTNRPKPSARISGAASNILPAPAKGPNANCISASNRNHSACWKIPRETVAFFEQLRGEHKNDSRLDEFLGVNYDTCHFAIEFEEPQKALAALQQAGIKISKIHLSSALKTRPTQSPRGQLKNFADDVYLHQVIARGKNGNLTYLPRFARRAERSPQPTPKLASGMADPFSCPAACAGGGAVSKYQRPFARRAGFARGKPGTLFASGDGNLHLGSFAAGIEVAKRQSNNWRRNIDWTLAQLAKRGLAAPKK